MFVNKASVNPSNIMSVKGRVYTTQVIFVSETHTGYQYVTINMETHGVGVDMNYSLKQTA